MPQFNVASAKARFSELVQRAMLGEEVIVTKENKPVVKIVPLKPAKRKPGTGKGIWMAAGFDAPLDDFREYM
jgi:prevent-host-death family protein